MGGGYRCKHRSRTLFIWCVMSSSQFWHASIRVIILPNLFLITACEVRGFPKTILWLAHLWIKIKMHDCVNKAGCQELKWGSNVETFQTYFRHSSTMTLWAPTLLPVTIHLSWLKLLRITDKPLPTSPRVLATGTRTLSKITYAVPAEAEYDVLIGLVDTPSPRSISITVRPF